jgi:mgtE-like transporter
VVGEYRSVALPGLGALAANSVTSLVAGAVLGSLTGTFERLPGLLVLVPAAIGLRGNVFSSLGSRLSTAIHTGTFRPTLRPGTVMGDNVSAALLLTVGFSFVLAAVAKVFAVVFGVADSIPLTDLALVSVAGGLLASVVVLAVTAGLAVAAERRGWDLDNLVAPLISTLGDVLTLPALWVGTLLLGHGPGSTVGGVLSVLAGAGCLAYGVASRRELLRPIVRQSSPVLFAAVVLSTLAGLAIESRLALFADLPALLVLLPAFVSSAGALGGIQASRLATQLHLGTVVPAALPARPARRDALLVAVLALPVYTLNALGAHLVAGALGVAGPGAGSMLAVALLGGLFAVAFVIIVAYYSGIAAYRFGVDPDSYGIPVVTSSVDFVGALALIGAAVTLGIT